MTNVTTLITPRVNAALTVRDMALKLIEREGEWESYEAKDGKKHRLMIAKVGGFQFSYRTPFNFKLEPASDQHRYIAALHNIPLRDNLAYGLDIWHGKKVLNIEWDDAGKIEVVSFKRGNWQHELENLLTTEELYGPGPVCPICDLQFAPGDILPGCKTPCDFAEDPSA